MFDREFVERGRALTSRILEMAHRRATQQSGADAEEADQETDGQADLIENIGEGMAS